MILILNDLYADS
jgi:ribosome biogenesis SPOUT family RNA methylase Rps3